MNANEKQLFPPGFEHYHQNRRNFPLHELAKYAGQHVAFSPDGTRILASGADLDEVDEKLTAAGIPISQVVHAFIDPLDGD